jgi:hypothetical protein
VLHWKFCALAELHTKCQHAFLRHCQGGSQYLLSIYRLHGTILDSIISLIDLSAALCLFMVFTWSCMTGFNLPTNSRSDPESLIRKSRSRLSSPGSSGSHVREIVDRLRLSTDFREQHRHTNLHWWLPGGAPMISQLCPVPTSGLVQKRTSEMAVSNLN